MAWRIASGARRWVSKLARRLPVRPVWGRRIRYDEDGLITYQEPVFLQSGQFIKAYAAGVATGSWDGMNIRWRAHVACWAAAQAMRVRGDFVECGVNKGGMARVVADFTGFNDTDRRFYLLDTYEGLHEGLLSEAEKARAGKWNYEACYDAVVDTFSGFRGVTIVRGPVPETLPRVASAQIAYLSIDMNCTAPEIAAFRYFWPKLSIGGVVILDDYGWTGHEEQREAFDAVANEFGISILCLPTGQGIIVK